MKQSKRIFASVLAVLFALTLFPLSANAAVKITPPKQTQYVDIGGATQLVLAVSGVKKGVTLPIAYVSNNPGIATVDANGMVTGVAKGTATITASYDKLTLAIPVYVCDAFQTYTDGEMIQIDYPKTWELDSASLLSGSCKGVFVSPYTSSGDQFREYFRVSAYERTFANVQKAALDAIDYLDEYAADYVLLDNGKTKVAGMNAYQLTYAYASDNGLIMKQHLIIAMNNKYEYYLSYCSELANFDLYSIEVKRMLDSFKVLSGQGGTRNTPTKPKDKGEQV